MINELHIYKLIGRSLPQVHHASGVVNRIIKPIYNRKKRGFIISEVLGFKMELNPTECVDGNLLFCPQLYDYVEMDFLDKNLTEGDTFLDVGSHIGFYSLAASKKTNSILAIEASPHTYKRLKKNIQLNSLNIKTANYGVSDTSELLKLSLNSDNNSGGQTFINTKDSGIEIQCHSLKHILSEHGISEVKIMKIDVEGFEYKIFKHFLENNEKSIYPKFIITEFLVNEVHKSTGNQVELLESYGYEQIMETHYNRILEFKNS
jgi:FkbM family methyltransferase